MAAARIRVEAARAEPPGSGGGVMGRAEAEAGAEMCHLGVSKNPDAATHALPRRLIHNAGRLVSSFAIHPPLRCSFFSQNCAGKKKRPRQRQGIRPAVARSAVARLIRRHPRGPCNVFRNPKEPESVIKKKCWVPRIPASHVQWRSAQPTPKEF